MEERADVPMIVEIDDMTDLNPLILGLASMLALKLIAKAKRSAIQGIPPVPPCGKIRG
jgi:hypothetical protein